MPLTAADIEISYKGRKFRRGELGDLIKELPRRLCGPALKHVATFYQKKFRLYPRYKWVTRARAYGMQKGGPGFFSDKQRKFVMAGIRSGRIQPGRPHRTQALKRGWQIEGSGVEIKLVNRVPYAGWAYHPLYQARQLGMVGWGKITDMQVKYEKEATDDLWKYIIKLADEELENILTGK